MKFNWKILVAVVVIVGAIFFAISSSQSQSYSGKDMTFAIGGGPVTITNPSDVAIPVQLIGTGTRSFSIVNTTMEGVIGSSTRDGNGSSATQTFEFDLPPGESEFSIARGKDVTFVATTDEILKATVLPAAAQDSQTLNIVVGIIILVMLYYISNTMNHSWIKRLRPTDTPDVAESVAPVKSQGTDLKSYGDNRS